MTGPRKRIYFFANGIHADQISGGDIHFFQMAQASMDAGYIVHFFGGHALEKQLRRRFKDFELTLTDNSQAQPFNANSFFGQFRLLFDYSRRFFGSLRHAGKIQPDDIAYAVSDYWFDVWPVVMCRARRKMMIWHMQAPGLSQIIRKARADVDATRLASFYYWLSQNLSISLFGFCRNKHLFIVHPTMRGQLLRRGYREDELTYLSFGMDDTRALPNPMPEKIHDVVWIGRAHRQKGIDDLLATLKFLKENLEGFRAVLIGNLKTALEPAIKEAGLEKHVELSGFVSESEKFRLFCASRVFLMPSKFEGSPRVVGEALLCELPVVAYQVETYQPIFGGLVHYVPCFDLAAFQQASLESIRAARTSGNPSRKADLERFVAENSWKTTCERFLKTVRDFDRTS